MNTAHFKAVEFKCKCGGCISPIPSSELMAVLELVRLYFGKPVMITSGYRCREHNEAVGGAKGSRHLLSDAADIQVKDVKPESVYNFLDRTFPDSYGMAHGETFTHIDVRPVKARWSY